MILQSPSNFPLGETPLASVRGTGENLTNPASHKEAGFFVAKMFMAGKKLIGA
jgi:hypothetical protein